MSNGKNENGGAQKTAVTPHFTVSFPAIYKPEGFRGQEPKYSVISIFRKEDFSDSDTAAMKEIAALVNDACRAKFGGKSLKEIVAAGGRSPFRPGSQKAKLAGFGEGTMFCTLSSQFPPVVIDLDGNDVEMGDARIYAGCKMRAIVKAYAYDTSGNRGASLGLNALQWLGHGDRLDGRDAKADFQRRAIDERWYEQRSERADRAIRDDEPVGEANAAAQAAYGVDEDDIPF